MERKSLGPVRHDIAIICDFCGRMTADNARLRKALRRRVRAHELGQTYKWDEEDKALLAEQERKP